MTSITALCASLIGAETGCIHQTFTGALNSCKALHQTSICVAKLVNLVLGLLSSCKSIIQKELCNI